MWLYHFFLELFKDGKHVYILAGNHDWLGNNFVFEEAKKAFEVILNSKFWILNTQQPWQIHFITEPMLTEIEGEKIFFLPYFITTDINESTNKNENLSAATNKILKEVIEKEKILTVIHHHYINNTKFPGQKSIFHYKDVALDETFLDMPNLKFISGHLHQAFSFKNYLCVGSVRSTSSLEVNQTKYLWKYDKGTMDAYELDINPYVSIEENGVIDEQWFTTKIEEICEENKKNISHSPNRKTTFVHEKQLNLNAISLSLKVDNVDYEHIEKFVDESLRMKIKDIKLKKNIQNMEDIRESFETSGKNLSASFADRKQILKDYLKSKYPNDHQRYEETLHEMNLL